MGATLTKDRVVPIQDEENVRNPVEANSSSSLRRHEASKSSTTKRKSATSSKVKQQTMVASNNTSHPKSAKKEKEPAEVSDKRYSLLIFFGDNPNDRPFRLDLPLSSLAELNSKLQRRFNLAEDEIVRICCYDEEFKLFVQLDKFSSLPKRAKLLLETRTSSRTASSNNLPSVDISSRMKAKEKTAEIERFEKDLMSISTYQEELTALIEELQKENAMVARRLLNIPQEFIDPITQELMRDRMSYFSALLILHTAHVTSDGHTYEKKSIQLWLKNHDTSPLTNLPLKSKRLIPNINLRKQIESFREAARAYVAQQGVEGISDFELESL